ncbi:MAG: hypothetical protein O0V67_07340 [Methanocorpusculum sp.]|nr:hypothetical protein [Methanocorpusculum sp.]
MNRAERRRLGKKGHEPVINVKSSDIHQIKMNATKEASDKAFFLMLAIPVMVLHDKYGQLMKKEVDGKSREERFVDLCLDLYDSFEKDYVTLDDLHKCLWEEAGIKIERGKG